ncbi:hypothetical protein [Sphingobacterium griseoflavum]|uniref:Peptidase M48 domain-containing protein n=1 Tax=Sphingobacterium griseoflavum TaxID=1474952 RepID=A0ABQ3HPI8_9SPHI|nr:hypothetical protein [Sphingobacterium griseoflavum]GHE23170.1 hypothetical protein GCM10017764_01380 [Sphingobacterium griseoflavum]
MKQTANRQTDAAAQMAKFSKNKQIPKIIELQILMALSHYPELQDTRIKFVFTQKLKGSVMAARPVVASLLGPRNKRIYEILISPVFKLQHSIEPIHQVDDDVLVGWIGHELGHILDYESRNTWSVAKFGMLYWLSKRYIRKAERVADTFAVNRGMGRFILATKRFILGHSGLSPRYKDKIAALYLSPDDIVKLVKELEQKPTTQREAIMYEEVSEQSKITLGSDN